DCANKCGKTGQRYIVAEGHIRMMAAAQPFISGAISKTINLPSDATVEDIKDAYRLSWELGLKANALYRDGCKLSQPLSTKSEDADEDEQSSSADEAEAELVAGIDEDEDALAEAREEVAEAFGAAAVASAEGKVQVAERIVERIVHRPMRRRLPDTRHSLTHKFNIAGHEGYLTVGLYDDGQPGELFITMAKEGSTIGGLMDSLGTATSVSLQYGVPIESLVKKFTHQRFEPAGMTTNRDIPFAKSLVDYIFRWMGMQFIPGYREANAPNRGGPIEEAKTPAMRSAGRGFSIADDDDDDDALDTPAPSVQSARQTVTQVKASLSSTTIRVSGSAGSAMQKTSKSMLSAALAECQEDAPACDVCGTVTVRSGTCYKCLNCGNSMGCS
ncbi:MAG: vitamin B12-dependent ribonucleotide reductase, partial [Phycisphaerales bacterium]